MIFNFRDLPASYVLIACAFLSTFGSISSSAQGNSSLASCNEVENVYYPCTDKQGKKYKSRISFCRANPLQPACEYINKTYPSARAQGYAGTGISNKVLEDLCQMGALLDATSNTSTRHYVDTTLKGRFATGNSTAQEYRNQLKWFRSNCPAY